MTTAAIIVAAGRGIRAGGEVPKQWQRIAGQAVIEHTLDLFENYPRVDSIVLVVSADDLGWVDTLGLKDRATIAIGATTRSGSVLAGLAACDADLVLIHDAARCCCPANVIDRVLDALQTSDGAAPALAVTDALWTGHDGQVTGLQDRTGLYRAQTPQGFRNAAISQAHGTHGADATDDVEVARKAGIAVTIVAGDEANFKITTPDDFARAEKLLGR
jgi:2-C-methyl-D-erythritol 4-phosphate cytidylyltransferase/2-C-methyl-D-erythritol 2,4-cyclodiphosphate synthase